MAPAPGRLGDDVKMPVQVRMFPEERATVDAFAAALSPQSDGAALSRAADGGVVYIPRALSVSPCGREFMRNALLAFTPIIPATACHQRNYFETYSRSKLVCLKSMTVYVPLCGFTQRWRGACTVTVNVGRVPEPCG